MRATINKDFHVEQDIEEVWNFLKDPTKVVTCVPGAEITEKIDEENYKGKVAMKFGPVSAKYDGKIKIDKMDAEQREMVIVGRGTDSRGKGGADMTMNGKLTAADAGGTDVEYNMQISVTGMLAQFGSRLIVDVSNQVVNQFVANFKAQLSGEEGAAEAESKMDAAAIAASVVKNKLSGIFGGKSKGDDQQGD